MKTIYIAGAYSGDIETNVKNACEVAEQVYSRGALPFVPHLSVAWDNATDREWGYEDWMRYDFRWVEKCDGLYRMDNESPGADREVKFANFIGTPVMRSMVEVERWIGQ